MHGDDVDAYWDANENDSLRRVACFCYSCGVLYSMSVFFLKHIVEKEGQLLTGQNHI